MKKLLNIFASLLLAAIGMVACSSDDDEVKEDFLKVSPTTINVSEAAQDVTVVIESSGGSGISVTLSDRSWCNYVVAGVVPKGTRNTEYLFHIAENPNKESRQTIFTVVCGQKTEKVTITQAGSSKTEPDPDEPKDPVTPDNPDTPTDGSVAFAKSMGLGWNLGNQMDAWSNNVANETCWGNKKCTQATMDAVKAAGITTVRIPVTWLGKYGAAPDYTIDAAWLDRVAEIVGYAKNAGLKAIINMHHDGADSKHWLDIKGAGKSAEKNAEICAQVTAMWTQIANKFKDEGEYLIFEAFNEIHDGGWGWGDNRTDGGKQYAALASWNQAFVDAVRATGGNNATRYLGIPAYCTNINIACFGDPWNTTGIGTRMALPNDPATDRLLVSVHNYDLAEYSLQAKFGEWGHTSTQKDTKDREKNIQTDFKNMTNAFTSKGIGIYVGEFGCVNRKSERDRAFQKYFLEYYCKVAHDAGIPCVLWDNGSTGTGNECHGYFNHATGAYVGYAEEVVALMVKAWTNEDSSYTLQSVYDNAPE